MPDHPSVMSAKDLECGESSHGRSSATDVSHAANEEAIYVLESSGTLRIGEEEVPISKGDYVTFPAAREGAHQLVNTSNSVLRYLCFSTMVEPDAMVYPDSGKIGVFVGAAPGSPKANSSVPEHGCVVRPFVPRQPALCLCRWHVLRLVLTIRNAG